MKNLIKSFVGCAALLLAASASAGTLYWQVQDADVDFEEAWLVADSGSGTIDLQGVEAQSDHRSTALTQTDLSAYENSGYLFYVELVNYTTGVDAKNYVVDTGYKYGYGDLVSSGYVATGLFDAGSIAATAAAGGGLNMGSPTPEPSSGLLLLMGGAILALRRRRQK